MNQSKFTYKEFARLLKIAKNQFVLKTENSTYFINVIGYESYNENGFVAHNELKGTIEILQFADIFEVIIDCKKITY